MKKLFILFAVALLGVGNILEAQSQDSEINPIITSLPFLRIMPDARGGALGDGGIALSGDANSMHLNASRLAFVENEMSVGLTYVPWLRTLGLNDTYLAYISGYRKLDEIQTVGLSFRYFSYGSINFTDINGIDIGQANPNDIEIAAAYARKLSDNFSIAATLKFLYSNLAAGQFVAGQNVTNGVAGAADLSFTYKKDLNVGAYGSELTVGAAFTNLGSKISYRENQEDFLPANMGIGIAYKLYLDDYNTLTFLTDINKYLVPTPCNTCTEDPPGTVGAIFSSFNDAPDGFNEELREFYYSFGAEYFYNDQFAIRAGYFFEDATKGARKFFTLGLGLKYNVLGLDFSYLITSGQRNPLDNTFRFSLTYELRQ